MNKIAALAGLGGLVLAILSQVAILNDWVLESVFRGVGLVGYILIISAVAYFTLMLMNKWYKREEIQGDF